jgi:hypothetical protein
MSEVTRIFDSIEKGDPHAADELLPLVYSEFRKLAAAKMARENPGHTLQPTALVHEAWIRPKRCCEKHLRWPQNIIPINLIRTSPSWKSGW